MTRTRALVLSLVVVLATAGLAVAAGVGRHPAPVERVHRYYPVGPSAEYEGDSGGIGVLRPLRFRTPDGDASTGVAEVSFGYRTRGPGPFEVSVRVGEAGGPRARMRPDELPLAPAPDGASGSVRFLLPELEPASTYEVHVGVNSSSPDQGRNMVRTRAVVLTVDLS